MMKNQLISSCSSKLRNGKSVLATLVLLLFFAAGNASLAATKPPVTIKGTVTDSKGVTLIGVSVKSSAGPGAVTDNNGLYTLITEDNASLTFSYLGYTAQTVPVNGRTTINVTLVEAAANQLNDVVVVGYGTQKRKDVTGAITTIKLEDSPKEAVPLINPLEALQGTSGINIGPSTTAGATPAIVVRGQNSITANTNPLIVLDGVIFNGDMNEINMNDVASYDILKDASSAAIYGSRSQNGVVLITTKRGKTDKPQINFNTYYGSQSWTRVPDMRTGDDYIQWRTDLAASKGSSTALNDVFSSSPLQLKAMAEGHTMDWLDEIQQYAPVQNYNLSVSGRTDKVNYYFSAGYMKQKGVLANDNFSKPSITLKVENTITDWLSYGAYGYYSSRDYSGIPADLYIATYMSPFSYKYLEGTDNTQLQRYPEGNSSLYNPYWGNPSTHLLGPIDDNLEKYSSIRGTGFINVKFPFVKGLSYRLNVTGERQTSDLANFHHETAEINTILPENIANPTQFLAQAYGDKTNALINSYLFDNLLTYNRDFGDHHFDALIGYTRDYTQTESLSGTGNDYGAFGTSVLGYYGLQNAATQTTTSRFSEASNVGYIGRLNYNYKSRYYATVNFRRDGYSAFAPGHKFGNFPGASVAWVMSEEDFMKKFSWLNNLKLRASYGHTGNQGIDPYATQAIVGTHSGTPGYPDPGFTVFGNIPSQYTFPSQMGNAALTWEKTEALNFGVDFSLLSNRLSGTIDIYKSSTTDQLFSRKLPIFTGYDDVNANFGQVDNKGIEVSLNSVNMSTSSGFKWETGVGFWMNRNKLVHIDGVIDPTTGRETDYIDDELFIGKSLDAIYDYTMDGIVQASDADYIAANGAFPGDVKFKDINGDGKITTADRSVIGYGKENFNLNMSNTFTYKNFQLYFSINAIIGGGKNNYFESTNLRGLDPGAVTIGSWLNLPYYTPEHPSNEYPRPNYVNSNEYGFYQSRTFARLQNMALSYLFPKKITNKLKISDLKLYISGTNLFTITGWTGLDPANGGQIGGNGGSSDDTVNKSQPIMRTLSFGLNVGF